MPSVNAADIPVNITVKPNIPVGKTTIGGSVFAILAAVAAIYAGIEGNDTATATGGIVAALAALRVLGGRYEQAVAIIQSAAPSVVGVAQAVADDAVKPAAEA